MSQNWTAEEVINKYGKFLEDLSASQYDFHIAYKYEDFYGEWGMVFVRYVTPFLWVLPFTAALTLTIVFKRLHLFGPMQKCLILTMVIDVLFVMLIGLKDAVFNVLEWNYGFVEYKICMLMMNFVSIQVVIHATSLWIKCLMLFHRVLMFVFPFRFKYLNLKLFLIPFGLFHLTVTSLYCVTTSSLPIKKFRTVQVFSPGRPLEVIDACTIEPLHEIRFEGIPFEILSWFRQILVMGYFCFLPFVINCLCTIFLIVMVRKEITKVSLLAPIRRSKIARSVNYLVLIKVHIFLAVSFLAQETPIYLASILPLVKQDQESFEISGSIHLSYMYLTFAIGKPIDLFIYASLSRKVKNDLKNLLFCKSKTRK